MYKSLSKLQNKPSNKIPKAIQGFTDSRWENHTIYNHFESPELFRQAVVNGIDNAEASSKAKRQVDEGLDLYQDMKNKNKSYSTLYRDVAKKVKDKLVGRGFTTKMLYQTVEFTSINTGCMSKQRAMMGKRDCYFSNPSIDEGKIFHDIYINLSYGWSIEDSTIKENSYALYALTKELARLIPIRVFVVNHVGTSTPTCYSYSLKKFGQPINPEEFLFYTSDSKRTFGFATYEILNDWDNYDSTIGSPKDTVSIADFNLDETIDTIWTKYKDQS